MFNDKEGILMKVLSLFDGMSCGMLAMKSAGIDMTSKEKENRYVAYEIDKNAIKVSEHNFPMIEHKGDVFKADFTEYKGFDFVIGGSPCTFWSIAQSKDRETEAHGMGWDLFQQYVRAVKEVKPRYFIYENNKSMSEAIRESISGAFGFEPICINSALVSAQNRQRLYWVGIRNEDGTYRKADVEQPEDRGILLKDILESECDHMVGNNVDKKTCVAEPVAIANRTRDNDDGTRTKRFEAGGNKANCLTATRTDSMVAEPVEVRGMNYELAEVYDKDEGVVAKLDMPKCHDILTRVYGVEGKSPTITAMSGGNVEPKVFSNVDTVKSKTKTPIYEVKDGKITIKGRQYPIKLADGFYIIRKLTVTECKRLQTVPDDYDMSVISNTQAYRCLGNGWTVEVIAHLIKGALKD